MQRMSLDKLKADNRICLATKSSIPADTSADKATERNQGQKKSDR